MTLMIHQCLSWALEMQLVGMLPSDGSITVWLDYLIGGSEYAVFAPLRAVIFISPVLCSTYICGMF